MPLALILSSFVSASRIGGAAQQYLLAAHGIDPVLIPTVMFGRSPAKGATGQVTSPEVFARMLADVEADAVFGMVDLVITGHFSSAEQVRIAADALGRIRAGADRQPIIVVDPILGDAPKGLYVRPEVADAVAGQLVGMADWITPNLWELGFLTGRELQAAPDAVAAARSLGKPALISSAPVARDEVALLLVERDEAALIAHERFPSAPNGTGDLVTASFGAGLVQGLSPQAAAERAASAAAQAVRAALDRAAPELPIVALGEQLTHPVERLRIERL